MDPPNAGIGAKFTRLDTIIDKGFWGDNKICFPGCQGVGQFQKDIHLLCHIHSPELFQIGINIGL